MIIENNNELVIIDNKQFKRNVKSIQHNSFAAATCKAEHIR